MHLLTIALALIQFPTERRDFENITVEDVKLAITTSSHLGADTRLLRIEGVFTLNSRRQIVISDTAEGKNEHVESRLSITLGAKAIDVICRRPRKAFLPSCLVYDLAIRDCMFLQAATEALKVRKYKGLSLVRSSFDPSIVFVQDEYNQSFGASPMAEFDDQYRLINFRDGGR